MPEERFEKLYVLAVKDFPEQFAIRRQPADEVAKGARQCAHREAIGVERDGGAARPGSVLPARLECSLGHRSGAITGKRGPKRVFGATGVSVKISSGAAEPKNTDAPELQGRAQPDGLP